MSYPKWHRQNVLTSPQLPKDAFISRASESESCMPTSMHARSVDLSTSLCSTRRTYFRTTIQKVSHGCRTGYRFVNCITLLSTPTSWESGQIESLKFEKIFSKRSMVQCFSMGYRIATTSPLRFFLHQGESSRGRIF